MVYFKVLSTTWQNGQSDFSRDNRKPHQDSSWVRHIQSIPDTPVG
jgi:hypothetical protein